MIITSTPRARDTVRILDFRLHDRDCGHEKRQADDLDYLKKIQIPSHVFTSVGTETAVSGLRYVVAL